MNNRIQIVENSKLIKYFFFKWVNGFTFGKTIRLRNTIKDYETRVIWHEVCHVCQYERYGKLRWLFNYFIKELLVTYRKKTYEKEAYANETEDKIKKLYPEYSNLIDTIKVYL